MKHFVIIAILSGALTSCGERIGPSASSGKIINGNTSVSKSLLRRFRAVVKLRNAKGGTCTGTFISATVLVTAAHCVILRGKDSLGSISVSGYASQKVWVDSRYNSNDVSTVRKKYDIALVNFDKALTKYLAVNEFPLIGKVPKRGALVYVAGFGRHHKTGSSGEFAWGVNRISRMTEANLFVDGQRGNPVKGLDAVPDAGDSGGPMFDLDWKLVGTVRGGYWSGELKTEDFVRLDGNLFQSLFVDANNF